MDIEKITSYCLSKKGSSDHFPFDETTLVFKVMDKMFCLVNLTPPLSINLKCEPDNAVELREEFEEITPGYHMNKKHWNTIDLEGNLSDKLIKEMIDESYNLVVSKLPKKDSKKLILDN